MEPINPHIAYIKSRPFAVGVFAVIATLSVGMSVAIATGLTSPEKIMAQVLPPCCTVVPPPPVIIPPTPPVIVVPPPDVLPPCCTETTPPVIPPVTPPTPPVTPPVIPPVTPPTEPPPPPPPPPAYCPNRPDLQIDNLPEGYYVDANGNCVTRPVTEVRQCVFLTGTPAVIQAGDAVNLSWETEGVSSISISNVTGTLPVDGSTTVYPTENTTYVLTAPGVSNFTPCQTTVRITTIEQGPQCVSLTADKREIESGESVVLSWVTNNASSISINNGINTVTPTAAGSITVNPTSDTTYIATVPGAPSNVNCQVEVVIESTTCKSNCGGGGGGGRRSPRVVIDSVVEPLEEPLAFVYLSEVPYTGLELGTWGTVFYWIMLIGWSLALAYLVLFNAVPFVLARAKSFGGNVKEALNGDTGSGHGHNTHVSASVAHTSHGHGHDTHAEEAPKKNEGYSAHEGFRSFAAGEGLTIDDIVKGLSREIEQKHQAAAPVAAPTHEEVMQAVHTEFEAPTPAPEYVPAPTASASFKAAPVAAPMSDSVRDFLAALLNGDRETVFGMIRTMARQGEDTEAFVSHAACALDDAYRACIDGTTCHPDIAELTNGCHPSFLERLVHSLSGAVDGSYSSGMTGVKMALTRALNVVAG